MKRLLIGFMLLFLASSSFAYKLADSGVSANHRIYNTTLTSSATVAIYSVTLSAGTTIQLDMQAKGSDIRFCLTESSTEAYWTINQDSTKWNQYPLPLPVNTVLYFYRLDGTSVSTIEVYQNHL